MGPNNLKQSGIFRFMAGVTKIHDFVYFSTCLVQVKLFLEKKLWKFEKLKKTILPFWHQRKKERKKIFFSKKSCYFYLNLNSTCSQLTFEVYYNCFSQIFQIFNFLVMKFPSITTFILWPLVAKIVIIGYYFGHLWTANHQNIYLSSSFGHLEMFWQL